MAILDMQGMTTPGGGHGGGGGGGGGGASTLSVIDCPGNSNASVLLCL
jgi:Lanthionine-containing peptide SapB precursor RamS